MGRSPCDLAHVPVHPRACGELTGVLERANHNSRFIPAHAGNSPQSDRKAIKPLRFGSSPRMRGTRPATSRFRTRPPVHPRACGELVKFDLAGSLGAGSSPRMRGTQMRTVPGVTRVHRFIPAHAGNSFNDFAIFGVNAGSSPRMRGTRDRA